MHDIKVILLMNIEIKFIKRCFHYFYLREKTKLSSWIITIGKKIALGVTSTHLGVQLPAGCRSHGSTRWQCRTQTSGGAQTSSQNAASLPPRQGNGTRRKHTEELEGSHRTALGSGPKTMKLFPSALSKPAQFGRSHLFSLSQRCVFLTSHTLLPLSQAAGIRTSSP